MLTLWNLLLVVRQRPTRSRTPPCRPKTSQKLPASLAAPPSANLQRPRPTLLHQWEVSQASMPRLTQMPRQLPSPSSKRTISAVLSRSSMWRQPRRLKEEKPRRRGPSLAHARTAKGRSKSQRNKPRRRSLCPGTLPSPETRTGRADKERALQAHTGTTPPRQRDRPAILVRPRTTRLCPRLRTLPRPQDLKREAQWHRAPWDWEPVLVDRTANQSPRPSQVLMLMEGFNNPVPKTPKPWEGQVSVCPRNSPRFLGSLNSKLHNRVKLRLRQLMVEAKDTSDPTLSAILDLSFWVATGLFSGVRTAVNDLNRAPTRAGSILQSACPITCLLKANLVPR